MGANPVAVAVDPGGAEAYADNYYAATVSIIDTAASTSSATGSVTGSIPVGDGPLGIAVARTAVASTSRTTGTPRRRSSTPGSASRATAPLRD